MAVDNKIKTVLQTVLETSDQNLNRSELPNWDSLKHLDVIFALEEEFEITFEPDEFHLLNSVEEISKIVSRKIEA